MHRRERSIREQFERQVCSHCGAGYPPQGVVVVAHRGAVYLLLASCERCQHRALFLVSFPHRSAESAPAEPTMLDAQPHATVAITPPNKRPNSAQTAVTATDVEQMHRFLESFDGNFQLLFGE